MEINEFMFSDGSNIKLDTTWDLDAFKTTYIHPGNSVVKTVLIRYYSGTSYRGALSGIKLLDKDKKIILKAGWWEPNGEHAIHTIELEEDERIVGYRSGKRGETYARHYDFQLIIGRLE